MACRSSLLQLGLRRETVQGLALSIEHYSPLGLSRAGEPPGWAKPHPGRSSEPFSELTLDVLIQTSGWRMTSPGRLLG